MTADSAPGASSQSQLLERPQTTRRWCTVVHDDPVNTMSYVTWVFRSYFGFSHTVAHARMMEVHTRGRAVVSKGVRERMEVDVSAMHSYGLRATIEPLGRDGADGADSTGSADGAGGAGA